MKKINLILLTLVLTLSFSSFGQSNVAHVNSQEIIALMPETIAADAEIKSVEATYTKEIEGMRKALIEKDKQYASEEASVSEELNQTRMAEIADQTQRVQAYINQIQQELQKKSMDLMQPISDKYSKAVEAVADRMGFDYVFENNKQVLLVSKGTDITEEVKKELGL